MPTLPRPLRTTQLLLVMMASSCGGQSSPTGDPASDGDAGQDASPDAGNGGGLAGTMQCGSIAVASGRCADCADEWCCDQGNACAAHDECMALRNCLKGCADSDSECRRACEEQHPDGAPFDAALSACRMRNCSAECFGGADVTCGFSVTPAPCQSCAQVACCDLGYSTHAEPEFWQYEACLRGCGDLPCSQQCAVTHAEGALQYSVWLGCVGSRCAEACELAPAYTCGAPLSQPCGACVSAHCCGQTEACFSSPSCIAVAQCTQGCAPGDSICEDGCQTDQAASTLWKAMRDCRSSFCEVDCGG